MAKKPLEDIDETEYAHLYKCPGPHIAGGAKTYESIHAKTEDEAAALEDDGYFRTLPEAIIDHYGEDALKKPGEKKAAGKKGEPAKPAKKDAEAPKAPTLQEVQVALVKLKDAKNVPALNKLLKKFDVESATELKPDQYAAAKE